MKPVANTFVFLTFAICSDYAAAFLPESNPIPGGIAVVPLVKSQNERPQAWFGQRRLLVSRKAGVWYAIIGLSADQVPGRYIVRFSTPSLRETTRSFSVHTAETGNEYEVNGEQEESGGLEILEILENQWKETESVPLPLQAPVANPASRYTKNSLFGLSFNLIGETEIQAPAQGVVVVPQELEKSAPILAIDHGQGLISVFVNLAQVFVKDDQKILKSERVAITGTKNGNDQAPLVWILLLNGNQIDPRSLILKTTPTR